MDHDPGEDAPSDGAEPSSLAELQRAAFGPVTTDAERYAALEAQARLREIDEQQRARDAAAASIAAAVAEPPARSELNAAAASSDPASDVAHYDDPDARQPQRWTIRRIAPLATLAVVCLVVGGLFGRFALPAQTAIPMPTSTPTTAGGGILQRSVNIGIPPQDQFLSTIGATWFSRPQQPSDEFSYYDAQPNVYQPTTVRLVASLKTLGSVYVAQQAKPKLGVCLISLAPVGSDGGRDLMMKCASEAAFMQRGIKLSNDGISVDWMSWAMSVGPSA